MTDTPPSSVPYVPGRLGQDPATASQELPLNPQPTTTAALPIQPQRPSRLPLVATLAAVAVALVLAVGIGGILYVRHGGESPLAAVKGAAGPSPYRVTGSVTLPRGYDGLSTCAGNGGYQDIHEGAQVVISDSAGATIALGRLDAGSASGGRGCVLPFSVPNVPAGKGFYGIEVSHRGILRYEEHDISTREIELSLGS